MHTLRATEGNEQQIRIMFECVLLVYLAGFSGSAGISEQPCRILFRTSPLIRQSTSSNDFALASEPDCCIFHSEGWSRGWGMTKLKVFSRQAVAISQNKGQHRGANGLGRKYSVKFEMSMLEVTWVGQPRGRAIGACPSAVA